MWIFLLLLIIDIMILLRLKNGDSVKSPVSDGKQWTVYGTMGCGWTRKQLDYMKKNGKSFKFVDCEKEGCSNMDAFPTIVSPEGEKIVGYTEM